jgi:hypothetical protein
MPNKYSESNLVDLYLRAQLDGGPLPKIKVRGKELEDLVDSFVDEISEISTKLVKGPKTPDAQRGYYIELLNSLIAALPFMSGNCDPALGPIQLLNDLKNLELGKQSKRLKAARTGRSLDIDAGYFRGEVMAAVRFLTTQYKNETKACKWMAHNLEPYVNNRLAHVIPANAHNLEKTLKPETIRRWCKEFKKISAIASPKSRNPAITAGYLTATQIWTRYIAEKDVEEIKPPLGEEAATFILDQIILTTRDTRDPEETEEGD